MRYWMCGSGSDPAKTIPYLKELGFEAVAGVGPAAIEEGRKAGVDCYHFAGAFGRGGRDDSYLAVDINGKPQEWFGSTCPNKADVRAANLEGIRKQAQDKGVKGILIDGCRFASPASGKDADAFYTCFCPDCQKKAMEYGLDFSRMRRAVEALYCRLHGQNVEIRAHAQGLHEWLTFKRISITEHLTNYITTIKSENPELLAGIYSFTPSLAPLVGQSYSDLAEAGMDFFSPMIYRHYHDTEGPACLNFELAVIVSELAGAPGFTPAQAIDTISVITGLDMTGLKDGADVIASGFPVQAVENETAKAVAAVKGRAQINPIIQLDDDRLNESIAAAVKGGADAVSFFVYKDEFIPYLEKFFR